MKIISGQVSFPVRIVTGSPNTKQQCEPLYCDFWSWTNSFKLYVPLQIVVFLSQLHFYVLKWKCVVISFTAGEFWRSIRIPESSAVIILDMCVFPHCDHVYSGLWWCLLPNCPRAYIPRVFPPCWLGKFAQSTSFFILCVQLFTVILHWFSPYQWYANNRLLYRSPHCLN